MRITLSGPPYPVSASAITGSVVTSAMRLAWSRISANESSATSGAPSRLIDTPEPVMYTAEKPQHSASRAVRQSNTPGAISRRPGSSALRSLPAREPAAPSDSGKSLPVTRHSRPTWPS